MLLWKQAISYQPGLPLSLIGEETLIVSCFFCKFEISCPPKDSKIRGINAHCHFDRLYPPVPSASAQGEKTVAVCRKVMNGRGSLGKAWGTWNHPVLMSVLVLQGAPC